MQLEECKAAGGESGLDCFVSLKPLHLRAAGTAGDTCILRPAAPGRKEPIHGAGKGTGAYWERNQGTGGPRWWSRVLGGKAAAWISALPHGEGGMLGAVPGPASPRDGVDASAWAQPQRGGFRLSRGGLKHLRAGCPGGV